MGLGRIALILGAGALVAGVWVAQPTRDPAANAIRNHVDVRSRDDTLYPRYAAWLRSRAWLASAPGMWEGIDPFYALPDAQLGRERVVGPGELRGALAMIRGLTWSPSEDAWTGADGRRVPRAQVLDVLKAALFTPGDAQAICAVLTGTSLADVPDLAAQLRREPNGLRSIHLRPFSGERGGLLVDSGRPPYRERETSYSGYLASFDGDGWPTGWRVLLLQRR